MDKNFPFDRKKIIEDIEKELEKEDSRTIKERRDRVIDSTGYGFYPASTKGINLMDYALSAYIKMDDLGCIMILRMCAERTLKERIKTELLFSFDPNARNYMEKRMKEIGERGEYTDFKRRVLLIDEYRRYFEKSDDKSLNYIIKDLEKKTFGLLIDIAKDLNILDKDLEKTAILINNICNEWVHSKFLININVDDKKIDYYKKMLSNVKGITKEEIIENWILFGRAKAVREEIKKKTLPLIETVSYFNNALFSYSNLMRNKEHLQK